MEKRHNLFVGNYDNGIVVANICNAFSGKVTGRLAKKCIEVAPRAVHYLEPQDAAVIYAPLDPAYAAYYRKLYGYSPKTFSPSRQYTDPDRPLSLLENILEDTELLRQLSVEGAANQWRITAFISHPLVYELGRKTGLPVTGMFEENVLKGRVSELNDKALFQDACKKLGIKTPPSRHVRGWKDLVKNATEIYKRDGKVMLRRARAAGGLGNCEVSGDLMRTKGCSTVEDFLEAELSPRQEWENEIVLVEPMLDVALSPTTLLKIENGRIRMIGDSCRILKANASTGGVIPSGIPRKALDVMVAFSHRYAGYVRHMGGDGYFDIDWGILQDGSIVAFESNYRFTGNNHPVAIRQKLRPDNVSGVVSLSNDALKVPESTSFSDVASFLEERGMGWDALRGEGVVMTIPPAGGSMGYMAITESMRELETYAKGMEEFAVSMRKVRRRAVEY